MFSFDTLRIVALWWRVFQGFMWLLWWYCSPTSLVFDQQSASMVIRSPGQEQLLEVLITKELRYNRQKIWWWRLPKRSKQWTGLVSNLFVKSALLWSGVVSLPQLFSIWCRRMPQNYYVVETDSCTWKYFTHHKLLRLKPLSSSLKPDAVLFQCFTHIFAASNQAKSSVSNIGYPNFCHLNMPANQKCFSGWK